jgi:acetoacetyl-CoA synthetase
VAQIVEDTPQQHSPKWFIGARLNYAENLLIRYDDSIACTAIREHGLRIHYSYRDLRSMVQQMANAMKAYGLRPGDRVAGSGELNAIA